MRFFFAQRFGSGDGERKTSMTRQIAFEPLPASVLFGLVDGMLLFIVEAKFVGKPRHSLWWIQKGGESQTPFVALISLEEIQDYTASLIG